jgi:hypothetical protein
MTLEQASELLEKISKEYATYETKKRSDKYYIPNFYPTYRECVEMASRLRVHSDYDAFPEKLFREKAPNELPHEFNYRKNIYKPITVPYFHKAVNVAGRVWNRQNYEIRYANVEQERYFNQEYPRFGSIETYFQQIVTFVTLTDPNAVLGIMPVNLQYLEDGTFNDTIEVTPTAHCFKSKRVWAWKDEEYAIIRADYSSKVTLGSDGSKEVEDGLVFFIFDRNEIQVATQVGRKSDYIFDIELYYRHNLNQLPCVRLGGISVQEDGDYYYQSFYTPAIPALDQAVNDFSTLQMSKFSHAFLQKWEYVDECDKCNGSGQIEEALGFEDKVAIACSNCGGTGTRRMFGPLSVYQIQAPNRFTTETETKIQVPPAGFIDVKHEILDFLNKQVITNIQMAFELLSIDVMNNEKISGRETATGKAIDREELYSFLLSFSAVVFSDFEFAINMIGRMRFGDSWQSPAIRYPQNFEMRTDAELTAEIKGAPSFSKAMLAQQYLDTRFPIEETKSAIMKLSVKVDPYFNLDAKEVMLLVAGGMIEKWEGLMHFKVESIIRDLVYEDEGFLALDYLEQKKKIEEVAKRLVPQKNTLPLSDNMSAYGLRQNNRASGRSTAEDSSEEQGSGE